ncbi:ATP-binding protein [Actinomadura latina]|uniref:ATP-binding protein n=1 Tax=Actinomadura latina TaxID=163603 RepID=A0A846YYC2_9ACTN|nr:ATP-binding protein [Actinomadura latina]NKZ05509.1 ATP-binding protein [Actinomadura latina]
MDEPRTAEKEGAQPDDRLSVGSAGGLRDGAFPAWPLPPGPKAAGTARAIVRSVFDELGIRPVALDGAQVIVSEIATNAVVHGARDRVELWAHISHRTRPAVTVQVFDAAPWRGPGEFPAPPAEPSDACGGRGLLLVNALTAENGGRWGVHPTRSRLGPDPLPGKAVYFTIPMPAASPAPPAPAPWPVHERVRALADARGLRPRVSLGPDAAVIHFTVGLWVWVKGESLLYERPGHGVVRHPVSDAVEVVEQIVRHSEELATAASAYRAPSWDLH